MAVKRRYSTRLLLSVAAIGAAGGVLMVGLNYALMAVPPSTLSYSIYSATIGLWGIGSFIAVALFRLPGVAFLATVFAGVINLIAPMGLAQFTVVLAAAVIMELPFLLTLYRLWSDRFLWIVLPITAVALSTVYFLSCLLADAIKPQEFFPWIAVGTIALTLLLAFGLTWLAIGVAARLQRAGLGSRRTDRVLVEEPVAADGPTA